MELTTTIKAAATVAGSIGAIGTAAYTVDNRYAPAGEYVTVGEFKEWANKSALRELRDSFWSRMDDWQEAKQQGNEEREADMHHELIELLAEICAIQPTFRYCSTGLPGG